LVHTVLGLTSVLLVVLVGSLVLVVVCRLDSWSRRLELPLLVLAAPVVILSVIAGGLHHFAGRACYLEAARWDERLSVILPIAMIFTSLGAVAFGKFLPSHVASSSSAKKYGYWGVHACPGARAHQVWFTVRSDRVAISDSWSPPAGM